MQVPLEKGYVIFMSKQDLMDAGMMYAAELTETGKIAPTDKWYDIASLLIFARYPWDVALTIANSMRPSV